MLVIHAKTFFIAARLRQSDAAAGGAPRHFTPAPRQSEFVRLRAPVATGH